MRCGLHTRRLHATTHDTANAPGLAPDAGTSAGGPARIFGPLYWAQPLKLFGRGSWQFPLTANLMQCHLQEPSNSLAKDGANRWGGEGWCVRSGAAAAHSTEAFCGCGYGVLPSTGMLHIIMLTPATYCCSAACPNLQAAPVRGSLRHAGGDAAQPAAQPRAAADSHLNAAQPLVDVANLHVVHLVCNIWCVRAWQPKWPHSSARRHVRCAAAADAHNPAGSGLRRLL